MCLCACVRGPKRCPNKTKMIIQLSELSIDFLLIDSSLQLLGSPWLIDTYRVRGEVSIFSSFSPLPGLLGDHLSDNEAECCDVRWDSKMDHPSGGTLKRTASSCLPEEVSVTSAAASRLCSGRLKICLLALVLLHTVIFISASHNSTSVGVAAIFWPEESTSSDEWTLGAESGAGERAMPPERIMAFTMSRLPGTHLARHARSASTIRCWGTAGSGRDLTGAKGAGMGRQQNWDAWEPPP